MSIQVLSDVILPNSVLTSGVRGRVIRSNERTQTVSGDVSVNVRWDYSQREYEVGIAPMLPGAWAELEARFEITDAGAYGLLMLDPKDSAVSASEGKLIAYNDGFPLGTAGSGFGEPVLYMFKRYTSVGGARFRDRPIGRPLMPTVTRNGSAVTVGASPGNIAIDMDAGKVTFVADATQSMSSITVGASTVLTFANNTGIYSQLAVGQRVYITGVTGTAASILNNRSHVISAKSASSPYTLTISAATTGLTASSGAAFKYPQSTDVLGWSGRFYVPVHFATDELDWELVRPGAADTRLIAGPSVRLMQIMEMPA